MQVVPAHGQGVQDLLLEDLAVGHHGGGLCAGGREFVDEGLFARIGFDDWQSQFQRGLLDRIRYELASAAGRCVRTGEYGHYLKMLGIFGKHPQRRYGDFRRTGEKHFQHESDSLSTSQSQTIIDVAGSMPRRSRTSRLQYGGNIDAVGD